MAQSKASKRRRRRRRLWGKRKKETKSDRITCFSLFGKLPQEIQNAIWEFALKEEVRRTIALLDAETIGLVPSVQLISSISLVSQAPRTLATKFYNVEVQVFACNREPPHMRVERGREKGVLRLNFDYTTLFVEFGMCWHLAGFLLDGFSVLVPGNQNERREWDLRYEDWFGNKTKTAALRIIRSHITAPLTTPQRAQVKRVYDGRLPRLRILTPKCCWNCSWKKEKGNDGPLSAPAVKAFPNVWLSRALIIDTFNLRESFVREYALFNHKRLWRSIWKKLITCRDFPIRRAIDKGDPYGHFRMKDDEEADTDNNQ